MEKLVTLVRHLDSYLKTAEVADASYNGLQVEGAARVKKIMCAVDAGIETFETAVRRKADMVIVHHGHFWKYVDPRIMGPAKKRIDILTQHGISLYASHLPLDMHPVVGNNIQLLKLIGARKAGTFGRYDGRDISFQGRFTSPRSLDTIVSTLSSKLGAVCTVLPFGPAAVRSVGVLSGGGSRAQLAEAIARGLDLYITGDSTEVYHDVRDNGISVVFGGHHATETLGVKALAAHLNRRFNVLAEFVDLPTGL